MSLCGKIIYKSRTEASQAVVDSKKRRKLATTMHITSTYWCVDCKAWHTTSVKKRKKSERKPMNTELQTVPKTQVIRIDRGTLYIKDYNKR